VKYQGRGSPKLSREALPPRWLVWATNCYVFRLRLSCQGLWPFSCNFSQKDATV